VEAAPSVVSESLLPLGLKYMPCELSLLSHYIAIIPLFSEQVKA
jgi:hypothetical protein